MYVKKVITNLNDRSRYNQIEILANDLRKTYIDFCQKYPQDKIFGKVEEQYTAIDYSTFCYAVSLFIAGIIESFPVDSPDFDEELKAKFLEVLMTAFCHENDIDFSEDKY